MDLVSYLRVLRPHWWVILLATLLGLGVAAGWTLIVPKVYEADATGVVQLAGGSGAGDEIVAQNLALSKVVTYVEYGSSRAVAERTIDTLGLTMSPEALVNRVSVSNPSGTPIIRVTASASTPEQARDIASVWLDSMVAQIQEVEGSAAAQTPVLDENGNETVDASSPFITLVPIDSARLPTSPVSPNTRLALALGALIGLGLGIGYAVVRHALDRRIRRPEDVERQTGVPVVGTIPVNKAFTSEDRLVPLTRVGDDRNALSNAATAEALRELRTNLQFMNVDNPPRVIVVTSPAPGDGKSTIAANLAATIAASGQPTVLIDADLRRPMVAKIFGLPAGGGLSDVLAGRAPLRDVVHGWSGSPDLQILTAGKVPPNPSEVLGSTRMKSLLTTLSKNWLVIIDAPPLLAVTDAAILTNRADGAFVVASVGGTTYESLGRALGVLERANARTMGVILNRVPRGRGGYGYEYEYRYEYTAANAAAESPAGGSPSAPGPSRSRGTIDRDDLAPGRGEADFADFQSLMDTSEPVNTSGTSSR